MFEIVVWRYETVIFSSLASLKVDLSFYCIVPRYTLSTTPQVAPSGLKIILRISNNNGGFASTSKPGSGNCANI
jgi:hypothetical protein